MGNSLTFSSRPFASPAMRADLPTLHLARLLRKPDPCIELGAGASARLICLIVRIVKTGRGHQQRRTRVCSEFFSCALARLCLRFRAG
jgi:hypothetical protein